MPFCVPPQAHNITFSRSFRGINSKKKKEKKGGSERKPTRKKPLTIPTHYSKTFLVPSTTLLTTTEVSHTDIHPTSDHYNKYHTKERASHPKTSYSTPQSIALVRHLIKKRESTSHNSIHQLQRLNEHCQSVISSTLLYLSYPFPSHHKRHQKKTRKYPCPTCPETKVEWSKVS